MLETEKIESLRPLALLRSLFRRESAKQQ